MGHKLSMENENSSSAINLEMYISVPFSVIKTVWSGCRRNRVIREDEKDSSLLGKEKWGLKCSLSCGLRKFAASLSNPFVQSWWINTQLHWDSIVFLLLSTLILSTHKNHTKGARRKHFSTKTHLTIWKCYCMCRYAHCMAPCGFAAWLYTYKICLLLYCCWDLADLTGLALISAALL